MNNVKSISDDDLKTVIRELQDKINNARKDYEHLLLSYRIEQKLFLDEYNQRLYKRNNGE